MNAFFLIKIKRADELNERIEDIFFRQQITNNTLRLNEARLKTIEENSLNLTKKGGDFESSKNGEQIKTNTLKSGSNLNRSKSCEIEPQAIFGLKNNTTTSKRKLVISLSSMSDKEHSDDSKLNFEREDTSDNDEREILSRRQSEVLKKLEDEEHDFLNRIYLSTVRDNKEIKDKQSVLLNEENSSLLQRIDENIRGALGKDCIKIRRNSSLNFVIERKDRETNSLSDDFNFDS
jgi:hypothetical protein